MPRSTAIIRIQPNLSALIQTIRGHKAILDEDLELIFGVATRRLNEQVKRNASRFPADFVSQRTSEEFKILMLQDATSSSGYGGRRKLPFAFTEHGAIMAANVLKSSRALFANRELARGLMDLERKEEYHDNGIRVLFKAFKRLIAAPARSRRKMGFEV